MYELQFALRLQDCVKRRVNPKVELMFFKAFDILFFNEISFEI
jgi:hypothetical protein